MAYYTVKALICICMYCICASEDTNEWTGYKGRYGNEPESFEIVIPKKVSHSGEFVSNLIPHHYKLSYYSERKRNQLGPEDTVHYLLPISGELLHIELKPNHKLLSKGAIIETLYSDDQVVSEPTVRKVRDVQCHYTGHIKKQPGSRVSLSTCFGLTGYIMTNYGQYFIEPAEGYPSLNDEEQPHLVYKHVNKREIKNKKHKKRRNKHKPAKTKSNPKQKIKKPDSNAAILSHAQQERNKTFKTYKERNYNLSELYLETLIVLDKSFMDFHVELDAENYLMTIMNMAYDLFHDKSLETSLNLVIVRILRMTVDDPMLKRSKIDTPESLLDKFRKWQGKINPIDDSHPNHHDLAVLLTRTDICENNYSCGLMGIARLASICNPLSQAIICQDSGLVTGFTIAHQIGHSLGMQHDTISDSGCPKSSSPKFDYVMTTNINMKINQWSPCSARTLKMFLELGLGHCMFDIPTDHSMQYLNMLPGVMYDSEYQCQNLLGPQASNCDTALRCDTLECRLPNQGCINTGLMPAPGTKCDQARWCYRGECLEVGSRPGAIDGGWGPWSEWSSCSRTCGSGVSARTRVCDSPFPSGGGKFCKGADIKHKICNNDPCGFTGKTFRDVQCEQYNSWVYPEDGVYHDWSAYTLPHDNPCSLTCINDKKVVATLSPRVIDGTSCLKGMRDVCISGKCMNIPCDLVFDSKAKEDICGVCHGDGTTCKLKQGMKSYHLRNPSGKKYDVMKTLDVPIGTRNIKVQEVGATKSRIQIRNYSGKEILVKGYTLGMFDVAGSKAWLGNERKHQEALHIPGPIKQGLSIWVIVEDDCTIEFSYAVQTEKRMGQYDWDFVEWRKCSAVCGPGTAFAEANCVEKQSGIVDDSYCNTTKPRAKVKPCEISPCAPRWMINEWSPCDCKMKRRERVVRCMRPSGEQEWEMNLIPDIECGKNKPKETERCHCQITKENKSCPCQKNNEKNKLFINERSINYDKKDTSEGLKNEITMSQYRYVIDSMDPEQFKITIKTNTSANEKYPGNSKPVHNDSYVYYEGIKAMKLLDKLQKERRKLKHNKVKKRKSE